jgi:hypothetical protein
MSSISISSQNHRCCWGVEGIGDAGLEQPERSIILRRQHI